MPELVLTPEASKGARSERIHLNPSEVAGPDRIEIDLHAGPIQVREQGIDWGDDAIEAFMAQGQYGQKPVDYRLPNRIITIPLILGAIGDFDEARIALQAETGRINEEGGTLKREIIGGTYGEAGDHLFADLVKATLKLSDDTNVASAGFDPNAELILEALSDFYGDPIELPSFEGTGAAATTIQTKGTLPGRVDLTVTEKSGTPQLGLGWHFRCQNYSPAPTAAWDYQAELLTPLDSAAEVSLTGASGKTIRHNNLGTGWTPVLSTNLLAGGAYLTHQGLYDVWARVYTTSATPPWLRLLYDVGDSVAPSENVQAQIPGANGFYLVNLGQISLRPAPMGTHRWQGTIQARGEVGGENIYVDRLWLFCADEGSGILKAPPTANVGIGGFKARDEFTNSGSLQYLDAPRAAPVGGNWAEAGKVGVSGWYIEAGGTKAKREATDSKEVNGGSFALSGVAAFTTQAVQADFTTGLAQGAEDLALLGVIARYVNTTNFLRAAYAPSGSKGETGHPGVVYVEKRVAGTMTTLGQVEVPWWATDVAYSMRLSVGAAGNWALWVWPGGAVPTTTPLLVGQDSALASAGALASGKPGFYGMNWASAPPQFVDNFAAWVPDADAVLYANRNARLTWQGNFRQSEDGVGIGPVAYPGADLPRIPVSGPEARPVEVALKPSRSEFGAVPDNGLDAIKGQLSYRPCWSGIPAS